jgi:hypothetical protein
MSSKVAKTVHINETSNNHSKLEALVQAIKASHSWILDRVKEDGNGGTTRGIQVLVNKPAEPGQEYCTLVRFP